MKFAVFSRLASDTEKVPLIVELWQYFIDTYYTNEVYYTNLNMDTSSMIVVKNIILGIFIGLSVAAFSVVFNKRVLGDYVRTLLKAEALSPDTAKTLEETGYLKKVAIRSAVKKSINLRRVVKCREEEAYYAEIEEKRLSYEEKRKTDRSMKKFSAKEFRVDPLTHHFYIPEELKYTADVKFEKKGTSLLGAILFVIIMAVAFVVLLVALPGIFELLDGFVGNISGKQPVV